MEDMRCPGVKPQMQQCAMPITCEVLILPVGYKERLICPFSCRIVILLQIIVHGTIEEGACKPFELCLGVALEFLDVIISRVCSVCVLRRFR